MIDRRELLKMLTGGVAGIPAVKSVERVDANTNDVIIFKFPDFVPQEYLARCKANLEPYFPNNKVIVISGDIDVIVIRGNGNTSSTVSSPKA